jgi:hypothetical protein
MRKRSGLNGGLFFANTTPDVPLSAGILAVTNDEKGWGAFRNFRHVFRVSADIHRQLQTLWSKPVFKPSQLTR